ncbi:MAG: UDP-N-acetylmuramoyl-tripeptide--D-alanyl-D-alanine ligase [Chlorobi bacterium]|nr:UDP-N-acetylmuramoyl-tripeptide--D-alanyl-D-alanine ligase [Chlorobiota bacterium]
MIQLEILNDNVVKKIYRLHSRSKKVVFDTREIEGGELFWALPGSKTHGDQFVQDALSKGAIGAICSDESLKQDNVIVVEDTLRALQEYASWYRSKLQTKAVIGITGSSGKTTTRALTAHVLSGLYRVSQPEKNYNNHIGVPITILNTPENIDFLVLELGANHIGEIEFLCQIARPTEGLITNIGRAHLEGFGSFEGVIRAKTELYKWINEHGSILYVNCDDPLLVAQSDVVKANKIYYGTQKGKVIGKIIGVNPYLRFKFLKPSEIDLLTNLAGKYNLYNILAAAAVGLRHGVPLRIVAKRIATFLPVEMRSNLIKMGESWIWFDAYNANPDSMLASLKSFVDFAKGNRLFIIGSMKELGDQSTQLHKKILDFVLSISTSNDEIVCVGDEWKKLEEPLANKQIKLFSSANDDFFLETVVNQMNSRKFIFIKGSRENKLELILNKLKELFAD